MLGKTVLVVDDEVDMVWALQRCLHKAGYEVLTAHNGLDALEIARTHRPALVVLDINMPVLDGLGVCERMRADINLLSIPILFLTIKQAIVDRVFGLDHGADDYMTKPFDLSEFLAHIRALLRRGQPALSNSTDEPALADSINSGEISLFTQTHLARVAGKEIELTPIEFDLLYFLMGHPQENFSSKQLLETVWNYPDEFANTGLVRWHIKNLRCKIESDPDQPTHIVTVGRQGYRFN